MNIRLVQFLLAIALCAVFVNIYLAYNDYQINRTNRRAVTDSYEIIRHSGYSLSLLKEAETEQRGYLLTGKPTHLDPYLFALNDIKLHLDSLSQLTQDDTIQYNRSQKLKKLFVAKIEELNLMLSLYHNINRDSSLRIINTGRNKEIMDSARMLINKMYNYENKQLILRQEKLEKTDKLSRKLRYTNLSFIGVMILIAISYLTYQKNKIKKLVNELQTNNKNLEMLVQQRTEELQVANEELQSANEELHSANEELVSLNDQLNATNEEKNKFIGMAAHDLKSPINSIKGLVQLFQTDDANLTEEQKEYLRYMNQSTGRMIQMIGDILNVNKIEEGKQAIKLEKFNIYHFIEDLVYGLKVNAEKKNIRIFLKSEDENLLVNSDKNAIAQIIENLISNAVKFSPTDRNVYVNIFKKSDSFILEVKDEGQGIKTEELPHLFEKFNKLSSRPTAGEDSTGLGLSIVKSLVESLDGNIYAESEYGKGATFIVELPIA